MDQSPFGYEDAEMTDPTPQREATRATGRGTGRPTFLRRLEAAAASGSAQSARGEASNSRSIGESSNSGRMGRPPFMSRLSSASSSAQSTMGESSNSNRMGQPSFSSRLSSLSTQNIMDSPTSHDMDDSPTPHGTEVSRTGMLGMSLDDDDDDEDAVGTPTPAVPPRRPNPRQTASFQLNPPRHLPGQMGRGEAEEEESPTRQRPRINQAEQQPQQQPQAKDPQAHPPRTNHPPLSPHSSHPHRHVHLVTYMEFPIPPSLSSSSQPPSFPSEIPISSDIRCFHPSIAISYDHRSVPKENDPPNLRLEFWTLPSRNHAVVMQLLNFVVRVLCRNFQGEGTGEGGEEEEEKGTGISQEVGTLSFGDDVEGPEDTDGSDEDEDETARLSGVEEEEENDGELEDVDSVEDEAEQSPNSNPPTQQSQAETFNPSPISPVSPNGGERQGYRQVWLKGWTETRAEAAWIIEEIVRKENRDSRGFSTLGEGWKWGLGEDGVIERAMRVEEERGVVRMFEVFKVGVEE